MAVGMPEEHIFCKRICAWVCVHGEGGDWFFDAAVGKMHVY